MFKRGNVYWTKIRHGGKLIQKSLETTDKKLAQMIEAKVRTELVEGKFFDKVPGERKTIQHLADRYLEEKAVLKSSMSRVNNEGMFRNLFVPFFGDMAMSEITPKHISKYREMRKKKGLATATINRELALLKRSFNVAIGEWEWVTDNPVARIKFDPERNQRDRWLTGDEEEALMTKSPPWLQGIVLFALNTGMRQGEILALEWGHVDLFRKTATVMKSKNWERRTIPLNQMVLELLVRKSKNRHIKSNYVFSNSIGNKTGQSNVNRAFRAALEKSGFIDLRFHDLRHTFATRMTQKGIDLYVVSKLLGHKDFKTTQRYAHHCPESLRVGVDILESGYNLATVEEKAAHGNL